MFQVAGDCRLYGGFKAEEHLNRGEGMSAFATLIELCNNGEPSEIDEDSVNNLLPLSALRTDAWVIHLYLPLRRRGMVMVETAARPLSRFLAQSSAPSCFGLSMFVTRVMCLCVHWTLFSVSPRPVLAGLHLGESKVCFCFCSVRFGRSLRQLHDCQVQWVRRRLRWRGVDEFL